MTMWLVSVQADLLGMYCAGQASLLLTTVLFTPFFLLPVHFYCRENREDVIAYQVSSCIIGPRMALTINR